MTFFSFKQKPIELIAYTDSTALAEMFPIVKGSSSMPNYYKTMPHKTDAPNKAPFENTLNYKSTIRSCYGINQFHLTGFVMPLWSDYSVVVGKGGVSCISPNSLWENHAPAQSSGVLDSYHTIKLISPWVLRCKENVKFMMLQNYYAHNSNEWSMPPGIVDFKHQSGTHNFLMLKKQEETKELIFNAGTPLMRLIPLTEREVVLRVELVDDVDKKTIVPSTLFFFNGMSRLIKQAEKQESQCPFHREKFK